MSEKVETDGMSSVTVACEIQRKDPRLPRFVVIPNQLLALWSLTGTVVTEATVNGTEIGRRSLKPWDADRWFVELPEPICRLAGVEVGDRVRVSLRLASTGLPAELAEVIAKHPEAKAAWASLSVSRQRMIREHVLSAKASDTRRRRAERALGVLTNKR